MTNKMSDIERDENFIKALDQFSKDYILSCIDRTEAKAMAFSFGVGYEAVKQDADEWVKCSDRFPIADDADENGFGLAHTTGNATYSTLMEVWSTPA